MLPSIEIFRQFLAKAPFTFSGFTMMVVGLFMFPTFNALSATSILTVMAAAGLMGLPWGIYVRYRAVLAISHCCFYMTYLLFFGEFLFVAGGMVLVVHFGGRADLKWLSIGITNLIMLVTLLFGIYHETKSFKLFDKDSGQFWQRKLEKYIDYKKYSISPVISGDVTASRNQLSNVAIIAAAGGTNISLLFELYGGGRNNAVFFAAPLAVVIFGYSNFRTLGPWIVKLYLLRKLEKASGCRFINADYEQIQALRRTFFLSRWLMKDYIGPQIADLEPSVEPKRKVRAVRRMHLRKRR